jgi:putative restriction endonuclease
VQGDAVLIPLALHNAARVQKHKLKRPHLNARRSSTSDEEQDIIRRLPAGLNIPIIANVRQGQDKFRKIVLSSYDEKCAITGISNAELLVAGHIVPWAFDADNRMNPRNGICLNRLHDKAYEDGLITIMPNLTIAYSSKLNDATKQQIKVMNGSGVFKAPGRFPPDPIFLEYHRDIIFKV